MKSGEQLRETVNGTKLIVVGADEGFDWWMFVYFEQFFDVGFDIEDGSNESVVGIKGLGLDEKES